MTLYAIAQLRIHDWDGYQRYVSRFHSTLAGYRGRLLVADDAPVIREGTWDGDKIVVLAFSDLPEYERWASSDEYARIAEDRYSSADTTVITVRGTQRWADPPPV